MEIVTELPDSDSRLMAAPARSDHVALLLGNVLHVWGGIQVRRITPGAFNLYPSAVKVSQGCKIDPNVVCRRSNPSKVVFFLTVLFGFAFCKFPLTVFSSM